MFRPSFASTPKQLNIQVTSTEFVVKIAHVFSFDKKKKHETIPNGVQITKSFDVIVIVKYSYHFPEGGLLIELQWHVNQNKIVAGFLQITFYSLGKVTRLLHEKLCFFLLSL